VLAIGAAILLTAGCKRSEQTEPAASASASAAVIATSAPLSEEVYEDEPAASAATDGGTESRPRRHAPAATKRRPEPVSAARMFDDYGFPVLSAIEHLCGRREYPVSGVHLTWDAFASDIPPGDLVDRYKRRIGESGFSRRGAGGAWNLPADAQTARTLEVLAVDAKGPHRACVAKPGPGAKSVIVISRR
jgi:hypothetical protein